MVTFLPPAGQGGGVTGGGATGGRVTGGGATRGQGTCIDDSLSQERTKLGDVWFVFV